MPDEIPPLEKSLFDRVLRGDVDALRSPEVMDALRLVHEAELASDLHDRTARGLTDWGRMLCCDFCENGEPGSIIILQDYDTRGYPTNPFRLALRLACAGGGEDEPPPPNHEVSGYQILIAQGMGNGGGDWVKDWTDHLLEKNWWHESFVSEFREIDKVWQRQREERWKGQARLLSPAPVVRSEAPRAISRRLRTWVYERDEFRCRRCGNTADDGIRLVVDHINPVHLGGGNKPENLQTLCESCNASKGSKPPHPHDRRGRKP